MFWSILRARDKVKNVDNADTADGESSGSQSKALQFFSRSRLYKQYNEGSTTPWLVPQDQPLELTFFRKVYKKMLEDLGLISTEEKGANWIGRSRFRAQKKSSLKTENAGLPLLALQRSMSRLFRILKIDRTFDAKKYDENCDGTVTWWEFCVLWREEALTVRLSLAERIFITLEEPNQSRVGKLASAFVLTAIAVSAGSFVVSTLPSMQEERRPGCEPEPFAFFNVIDTVCVILFTLEYLVRLYTSAFMRIEVLYKDKLIAAMCTDENIKYPTKLERVWTFVKAWPNIIDAVAIMPFYIQYIMTEVDICEPGQQNFTFIIVKLVRLMRVVRALRLGRRFQAVIIIMNAMRRSVRALWVLVLNLLLGMLVFGAIIFSVEQGTYNAEIGYFTRQDGWLFNNITSRFEPVVMRSPFSSVAHCFWWALVTLCTVGYGDQYPTSPAGMIFAGIAMIWSLCVLALPVGVIGSNFERVWREYDDDKSNEKRLREKARNMTVQTLGSIDPLSYSRVFKAEVRHDSGMFDVENDVFLGEVDLELRLSNVSHEEELVLALRENTSKADRRVSGELTLRYSWMPSASSKPGTLLSGKLEVTVMSAKNLGGVDWKSNGLADPYVVMTFYPNSPNSTTGQLQPLEVQTTTIEDEPIVIWDETHTIDFHWHQDGVDAKQKYDRNQDTYVTAVGASHGPPPEAKPANETIEEEETRLLTVSLPKLRRDLEQLKDCLPELQRDMKLLQNDAKEIIYQLSLLGANSPPAADSEEENPPNRYVMANGGCGLSQLTPPARPLASENIEKPIPRKGDRSDEKQTRFAVPGAVPDELSSSPKQVMQSQKNQQA